MWERAVFVGIEDDWIIRGDMDSNLPKSEENKAANDAENDAENKAENDAENNAENKAENNAENKAGNKTENNAGNNAENNTANNAEVKQDAVYPECASEDFIMQADVERDTQRGCADDEEMLEAMRQKIPLLKMMSMHLIQRG